MKRYCEIRLNRYVHTEGLPPGLHCRIKGMAHLSKTRPSSGLDREMHATCCQLHPARRKRRLQTSYSSAFAKACNPAGSRKRSFCRPPFTRPIASHELRIRETV